MDSVFADELKALRWPKTFFNAFAVTSDMLVPDKCIDNDCGLYVIKTMQAAFTRGRMYQHLSFTVRNN